MIRTYRFKITHSTRTAEIANPGSAEATLTKRLTLKSQRSDRVQQGSTATLPSCIDLIRPVLASELLERPLSTRMQLVHTEEVTGPQRDRPVEHFDLVNPSPAIRMPDSGNLCDFTTRSP